MDLRLILTNPIDSDLQSSTSSSANTPNPINIISSSNNVENTFSMNPLQLQDEQPQYYQNSNGEHVRDLCYLFNYKNILYKIPLAGIFDFNGLILKIKENLGFSQDNFIFLYFLYNNVFILLDSNFPLFFNRIPRFPPDSVFYVKVEESTKINLDINQTNLYINNQINNNNNNSKNDINNSSMNQLIQNFYTNSKIINQPQRRASMSSFSYSSSSSSSQTILSPSSHSQESLINFSDSNHHPYKSLTIYSACKKDNCNCTGWQNPYLGRKTCSRRGCSHSLQNHL